MDHSPCFPHVKLSSRNQARSAASVLRPFEESFWTSLDVGLESCRIGMVQPMHVEYIRSPSHVYLYAIVLQLNTADLLSIHAITR